MAILDDSALPLVRLTFSPEVSEDELDAAVAATAAVYARGVRVVFVVDISGLDVNFTVQKRKHLQELMETIQHDADRLMKAAIYVAPNVVGRGVATALNWTRGKRPYPVRVVGSIDEALALARSFL
jgi:hypothetical protein